MLWLDGRTSPVSFPSLVVRTKIKSGSYLDVIPKSAKETQDRMDLVIDTSGMTGSAEKSQGIEHEDELVALLDAQAISDGIDGRGKIVDALHGHSINGVGDESGRLG